MSQIFVIYILLKKNKNHWWNQRTACQNLDSYPKTVSNKDETEKRKRKKARKQTYLLSKVFEA